MHSKAKLCTTENGPAVSVHSASDLPTVCSTPLIQAMVRARAPSYDQSVLDKVCRQSAAMWKCFGKYEHLSKSQAADGDALASFQGWLQPLITAAPTLEFTSGGVFKKELIRLSTVSDISSSSQLRGDLWAAERADRVLTVCYHMRRLKRNSYELEKTASMCTGESLVKLRLMLNEMAMPDGIQPFPAPSEAPTSVLSPPKPTPVAASVCQSSCPELQQDAEHGEWEEAEDAEIAVLDPEKVVEEPEAKGPLTLLQQLYPEQPTVKPDSKASLPVKKPVTKTAPKAARKAVTKAVVQLGSAVGGAYYRKEYYKASNSVGFKRHCVAKKGAKQIGSISSRTLSKQQLLELGDKVLGSLNSGEDEEKCLLLAKFKVQKLEMSLS